MLKEKNKPIYKGIIALFSTLIVILLSFTINVKANSVEDFYADRINSNYEYKPTFSWDYVEMLAYDPLIINGAYYDYYAFSVLTNNDTNTPVDVTSSAYAQANNTGTISFMDTSSYLLTESTDALLIENYLAFYIANYGSYGNFDLMHITYVFNDLYYENEDYDYMPIIYTTNSDIYFDVSYIASVSYYDYQKNEFIENDTVSRTILATNHINLVPNFSTIFFDTTIGQENANTLFKVNSLRTSISVNRESTITLNEMFENGDLLYYNYYCLSNGLSEYYKDIEDKYYNVKANTEMNITETLGEQIGSFLDIEILPGLSFLGILGLALGIPLLIWILKLFLGG